MTDFPGCVAGTELKHAIYHWIVYKEDKRKKKWMKRAVRPKRMHQVPKWQLLVRARRRSAQPIISAGFFCCARLPKGAAAALLCTVLISVFISLSITSTSYGNLSPYRKRARSTGGTINPRHLTGLGAVWVNKSQDFNLSYVRIDDGDRASSDMQSS